MSKRAIIPFLMIFILFVSVAVAYISITRYKEMTAQATSIERRVTHDGTIVEMLNIGGDRMSIRTITPNGQVTGYRKLPESATKAMFSAYHVVGLIDNSLHMYHYESSGNTPERFSEEIIAYDINSGSLKPVAKAPSASNIEQCDVLHTLNSSTGEIFLGYFNRQTSLLTVWCINTKTDNSDFAKAYEVITDFYVSSIIMTAANELYALSGDSSVYRLEGDTWLQVFDATRGDAVGNMIAGEDGAVYLFLVSSKGGITRVEILEHGEDSFTPLDLDVSDLIKLHATDADNWVALDSSYRYVVSRDGERITISQLTAPLRILWETDQIFNLAYPAFAAAIILLAARHIYLMRKLHLLVKLLLAILPVFTVGTYFLVSVSTTFIADKTENEICETLLEYADSTTRGIDGRMFAGIDWHEPFNDEYYLSLLEYINDLSHNRLLTMNVQGDTMEHVAYTSYWVYRVDEGRVYTAICDNFVVGLEMKHFENVRENASRTSMLTSGQPTHAYLDGIETEMRWLAVLQPIFDGDSIVGYLEVARPMVTINAAISDMRSSIAGTGLLVFIVVMVVLVLVLTLSTHTLRRLKMGANAVSGGDYTARVTSHSWDETGEIASAFNKMSESVESSIKDITAVSYGYSRFVSDKLIELLGKTSIKDVCSGDYTTLTATQILLFTDSFDTIQNKVFFDTLGRFYNAVIPSIAEGGGLISGHSARGFAAMFEATPENTIQTMLKMYSALDLLKDKIECHVFLNYSGAVLGVTGSGENLNMITVSRVGYESYAVGMAGKRFGVRLIVTKSAFMVMGGLVDGFRHRFLGYLRLDGSAQELYDFFDCDTPEIRLKKENTKDLFQEGVRLYYAKDYSAARRIFVDIIKRFPEDIAAREYLYRSHYGQENGGAPMPVIDLS